MTKRQVNSEVNIKRRYTIEKFINGNRFFKSFNNITDALCYKYIIILRCKVLKKEFEIEQIGKKIRKTIMNMYIKDSEGHPLIQELYFTAKHFRTRKMINEIPHIISTVDLNAPVADDINSNLHELFNLIKK